MADTTTQWQDKREKHDVSRRGLLWFGLAFIGFLVVVSGLLWLAYSAHTGGFAAAQQVTQLPNDDELFQRDQLAKYQAAQNAELGRLAWTDSSRHFAKVPIDDAMKLLAARGAGR